MTNVKPIETPRSMRASGVVPHKHRSAGTPVLLGVVESGVQHCGLLRAVKLRKARGWGRGRPPPGVAHHRVLLKALSDAADEAWSDIGPRAHVLGLFLAPHNIAWVEAIAVVDLAVQRQLLVNQVVREGGELLDGDDRHVLQPQLLALSYELVVDLPRAEHEALHLLRDDRGIPLGDNRRKEFPRAHVFQLAHTSFQSEQVLRRGYDEGFPELPVHLPPEGMEVVCRCRDVAHLPVGLLYWVLRFEVRDIILVVVAHL